MKHRSVADIKEVPSLYEMNQAVEQLQWQYKVNIDQLTRRDRALTSFLITVGPRINEALSVRKLQFSTDESSEWLILRNLKVSKGSKPRGKIKIPREGDWQPFTQRLEDWILEVPKPENYLWSRANNFTGEILWDTAMTRHRAYQIVRTGRIPDINKTPGNWESFWTHYFRSFYESKMGEVFANSTMLAAHMGVTEQVVTRYNHPTYSDAYDLRIVKTK